MMDDMIRRLELSAPHDTLASESLSLILALVAERAQLVQTLKEKEQRIQELQRMLDRLTERHNECAKEWSDMRHAVVTAGLGWAMALRRVEELQATLPGAAALGEG